MRFQLPSNEVLYEALVARDPRYEGRAWVGVTTTGIFCRLTCPARKPRREHCQFFETAAGALEAGYRACKRCHPLTPTAETDPQVGELMRRLLDNPGRRWTESDVADAGYDPSTVRRAFRRHFGITFLEMARLHRLREGFRSLSAGGRVIDAQLDAGFDSSSGFRAAFTRLLGEAPTRFARGKGLLCDWVETPLGPMVAAADPKTLHLLEFADRRALPSELRKLRDFAKGRIGIGRYEPTEQIATELAAYFRGECADFQTPLTRHGSAFTCRVWDELQRIPVAETRSYLDIASAIGQPTAARAVARANGANQIAIVIPCHRVIGADGSLTGYGGGLWRKQKLIDLESRIAWNAARRA
ncbi:trifunctional transcriptional activator/DNA repair protein Ada/methylated-DNA--[protein]-cysteine S-methyltransferase [Wenzhouxiangella sp. XN24]|uniref:bifunctional transcriptional activator/DNA repair enzyme AdaA n=1 Tax=Wenzhouxiangella sp. XN24 TaxID=2713569 RepID=UPI0013E9C963|nr:trifunctional transcriptional activator/DNA repair protein Ada/methylated-DNA--[protein]-cysteine S-methyltransferase [Wenzhouxiangella sp. XN24]NGX16586.1 bifunctional transcriptional activator/DNA repair protein Ada [Wenzhouxiangella sp. XN24]